jgi:hypothetical protein
MTAGTEFSKTTSSRGGRSSGGGPFGRFETPPRHTPGGLVSLDGIQTPEGEHLAGHRRGVAAGVTRSSERLYDCRKKHSVSLEEYAKRFSTTYEGGLAGNG